MLKEATCDSDIITPIKLIKGAIQVQTQLTWALAFTGLLAISINARAVATAGPRGAPGRPHAMRNPPLEKSTALARRFPVGNWG